MCESRTGSFKTILKFFLTFNVIFNNAVDVYIEIFGSGHK